MKPTACPAPLAAALALAAGLAMTAPVAGPEHGGSPYPLATCPVSGEKLGADAVTVVLADTKDAMLDGTQVKFCCPKCEKAFKAEPAKYVGAMNDAIAKAAPAYPLKGCLMMPDEQLDADAKVVVYQNRVYKFCCGKCVGKFKKDPQKWAKEFDAQVAKQKAGAGTP
jgi:YHS domain-containing protein